MSAILSFVERDSVIHKMTGTTKLFFFLFWSIAAMITYDTRVLVGMFLLGCIFFKISKLKWKEISFALISFHFNFEILKNTHPSKNIPTNTLVS